MRTISRKLHSRRGASMLIALLFFVVCLTVGALILTAATASAAKSRDRYSNQQDYLAVASAARLLKGELGKNTYVVGRTRSPDVTDPDTGVVTPRTWGNFSAESDENADLLTKAYGSVYRTGMAYEGDASISAGGKLPAVSAGLHMKAGGDAVITLASGDYSMTVTFLARTAENTDGSTYDEFITSWGAGVIAKGAAS